MGGNSVSGRRVSRPRSLRTMIDQASPNARRLRSAGGLDVAARELVVARAGFRSNVVNEMPSIARWSSSQPRRIFLHPDPVGASGVVPEPPRWSTADDPEHRPPRVGVAVPAWMSLADRLQLRAALDPDHQYSMRILTSTLAAVSGVESGRPDVDSSTTVLCVDLRIGFSASVVVTDHAGATEVGAWGAAPDGADAPARDVLGLAAMFDVLFTAAAQLPEVSGITEIIVICYDRATAADVDFALLWCDHPWATAPLTLTAGNNLVAGGAAVAAENDAGFQVASTLTRALEVRTEDDSEEGRMHVVLPQFTKAPHASRLSFDLGPEDGKPLRVEVYEQVGWIPDGHQRDHRLLLVAHLVRERGFDPDVAVSFVIDADGSFAVGPSRAWNNTWQPGAIELRDLSASDRLVD